MNDIGDGSYWLWGWADSNRVGTMDDVRHRLAEPGVLDELAEAATQWREAFTSPTAEDANLVAGTGFRLDDFTCPNPACQRHHIDVLFRHAWHYFDRVLLPDSVGELAIEDVDAPDRENTILNLAWGIETSLTIMRAGAAPLVAYYPPELVHEPAKPMEASTAWEEAWAAVAQQLVAEADFEIQPISKRRFRVSCTSPLLRTGFSLVVTGPKSLRATDDGLRGMVIVEMLKSHRTALERDLVAQSVLRATLGATDWSHAAVLRSINRPTTAGDAIFCLSLPTLVHVPLEELLAIRLAEADAFHAFRTAITKAATTVLAAGPGTKPAEVAKAVARDLIDPELARIRQRLRAAERALKRRSGASVAVAGMATTCGIALGIDNGTAMALGLAAVAATAGNAVDKFVEEKQRVEMSDMYFLWRALEHAA